MVLKAKVNDFKIAESMKKSPDTIMQLMESRLKYLDYKHKVKKQTKEKIQKLKMPPYFMKKQVSSLPSLQNKKQTFLSAKYNLEFQNEINKFKRMQHDVIQELQDLEPSVIEQDHNAINGAKEVLMGRSKGYLENIFGPMTKKYAILSDDERKVINSFISRIDPRSVKTQSYKAQIMKDSKLITDDGRILPEDKKYLTKSSFMKKSFRSPKKKGLIDDLFLQPEQYVFLKTDDKRESQMRTQQSWMMTRTLSVSAISPAQVDKTGGVINLTHLDTVTKQRVRNELLSNQDQIILQEFKTPKDMLKSRNSQIKQLGSLVKQCDSLNLKTKLSPIKSSPKKKRLSQYEMASPQPFKLEELREL